MSSEASLWDRVKRKARSTFSESPGALDRIDFGSGLGDSSWLLYGFARSLKPDVAVEIGSARGRSACFVGQALKQNGKGKLFAIDPHTSTQWNDAGAVNTLDVMRGNLASLGLESHVEIVRDVSQNVAATWTRQIDLLFIDGDHSYDGVKRDWDLFSPFVAPFGFVVFHDTTWDLHPGTAYSRADMGVPAFVETLRVDGYPILTIDRDFGVSLVQPKRNGVTLAAKGSNR